MSLGLLDEQLAITLVSRFLNHLEAADALNTKKEALEKPAGFEDAIVKNLLAVGKFLAERQVRWGRKTVEARETDPSESNDTEALETAESKSDNVEGAPESTRQLPLAVVVLTDKIGKIGRKAKATAVVSSCLKLHAALLLSNCLPLEQPEAIEPVLRLCEHVQTALVGRAQAHSDAWKSCQELAKTLADRLCELVGDETFVAMKVKLAKKGAADRKERKIAAKIEAVRNPELAARRKNSDNRRRREVKKIKKAENSSKKKRR